MGFPLVKLTVIHTTSKKTDADTEESFRLDIHRFPTGLPGTLFFQNLPHDERERGRTDQYDFDVRHLGILDIDELKKPNVISMTILGDNAWLPSSFYVIGHPQSGGAELLIGYPFWPEDQLFSLDPKDGPNAKPTWFLDENLEVPT